MSTVKARQRVERLIIRRLILDAIRKGYTLSVWDGEALTLRQSTAPREILAALFTTDEDHLLFSRPGDPRVEQEPSAWRATFNASEGWVRLIYGNDGWDVISDYTTNLDPVVAGAMKLADRYQD